MPDITPIAAGLTLARKLLKEDRAAFIKCHSVPEAGLSAGDRAIADDYIAASAACAHASAELQRLQKRQRAISDRTRKEVSWIIRTRELGGAGPNESIAEMTERVIRERDALAARLAEPMVIGACITDGRLHATVMRKEANGHVTVLAAAELGVDMLHKRDCLAKLEPAAEPALEIRACGCSQAKNGRCVMGDYGSLPVRTKLYAGTPRPADHLEDVLEMARARPAVTLADEQIRDIVREASPGAATRRDGTTSTRIARAVEAAVLAANGLAGCGACGDACQSRGASRLADESPQIEPARPCRCGPDGCADSQCPGRSAEQCQKQEGGAA